MGPGRVDGCCYFALLGSDGASSGLYDPHGYSLHLMGDDIAQHQVAHLHEIHHKVLNDDTSWGAAIHLAARHPTWERSLLPRLTSACRTVHESFASFMSLSLARTRHPDIDRVLNDYPIYAPLAARCSRLLAPVTPGHRQDLAATAVARWSMFAPVLELMADAYPTALSMAQIPASWRPDHRFRALTRLTTPDVLREACRGADDTFQASVGVAVDDLALDETDATLDRAWSLWERAFIASVVSASSRLAKMPTVEADAHLLAASRIVERLAADGINVDPPRADNEEAISDVESVRRLTAAASLELRPPHPAALAVIDDGVDLDPVLALCAASSAPFVVIHGRLRASMRRQFLFPEKSLEGPLADPLFAIRVLVDDDGRDLILHAELPRPEMFASVVAAWADRGVAACCLTASCYLDAAWQQAWLPVLRVWPLVVLLDVGLPGLIGAGSLLGEDQPVYAAYVGLGDPTLKGLVMHVDGHPHVMLSIGDDLLIQLLMGQLADLLGGRLSTSEADWSEWAEVLSAVASSVLLTEARISFDGAVQT